MKAKRRRRILRTETRRINKMKGGTTTALAGTEMEQDQVGERVSNGAEDEVTVTG